MHQAKVSIIEIYKSKLIFSFPIVMCLVGREADFPRMGAEFVEQWDSLDSLTGNTALFVFGGRVGDSRDVLREVVGTPVKFCLPQIFSSSANGFGESALQEELLSNYIDETRRRLVGTSYQDRTNELFEKLSLKANQSQVDELVEFFGLRESDVPCLHVCFLSHNFEYIIDLSSYNGNVYDALKCFFEILEKCEYEDATKRLKLEFESLTELEKENGMLVKDTYYQSQLYLREFIHTSDMPDGCVEALKSVIENSITTPDEESNIRNACRLLKDRLDKENFEKIKTDLATVYGASYRNERQNHNEYSVQTNLVNKNRLAIDEAKKSVMRSIDNDRGRFELELDARFKRTGIKKPKNLLEQLNRFVDFKPNIIGIGVNFNEVLSVINDNKKKNTNIE